VINFFILFFYLFFIESSFLNNNSENYACQSAFQKNSPETFPQLFRKIFGIKIPKTASQSEHPQPKKFSPN